MVDTLISAPAVADDLARRGQRSMEQGDLGAAVALFQQALQRDPVCVAAIRGLGEATYRDGRYDLSEGLFRKALENAPQDGMLWGWLGTALNALQRHSEAGECLERALALGCAIGDVHRGLGIVALAQDRLDEAEGHWRRALALDPLSATVRPMLGHLLMARLRLDEGWALLAERPTRKAEKLPLPDWSTLDLRGRDVLVMRFQGLGDELFFLRWLPGLAARGARIVLRCSARLASILARLPDVDMLVPEVPGRDIPPRARPTGQPLTALVEDLPLALGGEARRSVPPSLRMEADPARLAAMRDRLASFGPAPYIGLTWRAGTAARTHNTHERTIHTASGGAVRVRPLEKSLAAGTLGAALRDVPGTLIALQRNVLDDELAQLEQAAGRPVADLCALGEDLEELLALMALLDDMVCVSNTNVHLRALAGRSSRILVPHPSADWRWLHEGDESPWFPGTRLYRQAPDKSWESALAGLARDLGARAADPESASGRPLLSSIGPSGDAPPGSGEDVVRAHALLRQGRSDEAKTAFLLRLQRDPQDAAAVHGLGRVALAQGSADIAARLFERALAGRPDAAAWQGDLGRARLALGQTDDACARLRAADAAGVADADHLRALGLLALQRGDWGQARTFWERGIQLDAGHPACNMLLARLELAQGRWAAGWPRYHAAAPFGIPAALAARRPWNPAADLAGRRVRILRNEGLGDELFALRFLPALHRAGAAVDLLCGPKLLPLLEKSSGFASVQALADDAAALPAQPHGEADYSVLSSELPRLLWAQADTPTPAPFALQADAQRVAAMRAQLSALGPAPWIAVTWRSGHPAGAAAPASVSRAEDGRSVRTQPLSKSVPAQALLQALAGVPGTLVALQRHAAEGEIEALSAAIGRPLHDLSAVTEDFESLLALLDVVDEQVCVSNTNVHLRAGLGRTSRLLLPHPVPEWRWMLEGDESPWFPGHRLYRQASDGDWQAALSALAADCAGRMLPGSPTAALPARVFWLTHGAIALHQGQPTSTLASARLRVLSPAARLAARGVDCRLLSERECPVELSGNEAPAPGDVLVISKSFSPDTTRLLLQTKRNGTRVVVDVCDNHFDHPEHGPHLSFLCAAADALVCNTDAMRELIRARTGRDARVIADPWEGPAGEPRFAPGAVLELLWFGHPVNLDTLQSALPGLQRLSRTRPLRLTVVTAPGPHVAGLQAWTDSAFALRCVVWSPEATWQALAECDLAIVPTLAGPTKEVRSPNRMVEALRAGRMVVAGPQPSHAAFADHVEIAADIAEGIERVLDDAGRVPARIAAARHLIEAVHAPEATGAQWAAVLADVAKVPPASEPSPAVREAARPVPAHGAGSGPLRLNLGCGDKILPGYTNVDVVESRAGRKPDVLCDLHRLEPFADNSVDEILAVHVVEHFWRWEVLDILKEWVRVLKPGGRMILECPNLISACEAFLRDPEVAAGGGREGQRSMWVFYGDPQWKDPYMVHRWGYTPRSLAQLMSEAGLVNARQEAAQFKLREPRDMRVVAEKPAVRPLAGSADRVRIVRFK